MCSLETFKIDLKAMKTDEMHREYTLDDAFFKALNASEVKGGALHVSVSIRKATGFFELQFHTEGTVTVPCDLCLDDMSQPIVTDNMLIAKLGAETNTDDDEVVIVRPSEGLLPLPPLCRFGRHRSAQRASASSHYCIFQVHERA